MYLCDICYCSEFNFIFMFSRKRILLGGEGNFKQYSYLVKKIIEHLELLRFFTFCLSKMNCFCSMILKINPSAEKHVEMTGYSWYLK